jgi:hypothetical protein
MPDSESNGPIIGDLAGAGQIINSEVAKRTYDDAFSPAMRQLGFLSADMLKSVRLFVAPFQLMAAWQDRFSAFCNRVREKVPEEHQQEAPAGIAKPVIEALTYTEDDSPLMSMFEELMAKAIDKREANKLSPSFPDIIKELSPLEAKQIASLKNSEQITDDLVKINENIIVRRMKASFNFDEFGGNEHHLTIAQSLEKKNIVAINPAITIDIQKEYPNITIPDGYEIRRTLIKLTMFGRWFASACIKQNKD